MDTDVVKSCKILIGCFVIQFLISGATRLSSIYFVESMTRYDVGRKEASFPFVITYMVKNLAGPIMGFLEPIIGMKWIITIGCVMATIGIGCCFFAEEILVITLLWGVILGLSYGFAHNMQAPLLNQHFKANKNKANGLVLAGSSLGGVLLPYIATTCIEMFGTSGSFLVLSAVIAHSIPASLLIENPTIKTFDNNVQKDNLVVSRTGSKNNLSVTNISGNSNHFSKEQTNTCLSSFSEKSTCIEDPRSSNSYLNASENNKNIASISNTADNLCLKQTNKTLAIFNVENSNSKDSNVFNSGSNNIETNKIPTNITKIADYLCMEQTTICLPGSNVLSAYFEDLSAPNSGLNENNETLANISNTADCLCMEQTKTSLPSSNVENVYFEDLSTSNSCLNNSENNKVLPKMSNTADYSCMEQTNTGLPSSNVENVYFEDLSTLNSGLNNTENNKAFPKMSNAAYYSCMEKTNTGLPSSNVDNDYFEDLSTSNSCLNNSENNKSFPKMSSTADYSCMEQTNTCLSIVENEYSEDLQTSNSSRNHSKNNKTIVNISNTTAPCKRQNQNHNLSCTVASLSLGKLRTSNSSLTTNPEKRKYHISDTLNYDSPVTITPNKFPIKQKQYNNLEKTKFAFRKFRIFIDPTFIVILIFNGLVALVVVTVWTIILDFVRDKKVPVALEIYYVILLPLTDILGRLGAGYIADKNFLSFSQLCYTTFFIVGAALLIIVYLDNFILLMVCEIVISVGFGMMVILQIIMVDTFMEEEFKTMAQSCRVMLYVPLSLTISPMLGYFRGGYGSYDYVFYILCGATVFCGCLAYVLPYLRKRTQGKINNSCV